MAPPVVRRELATIDREFGDFARRYIIILSAQRGRFLHRNRCARTSSASTLGNHASSPIKSALVGTFDGRQRHASSPIKSTHVPGSGTVAGTASPFKT